MSEESEAKDMNYLSPRQKLALHSPLNMVQRSGISKTRVQSPQKLTNKLTSSKNSQLPGDSVAQVLQFSDITFGKKTRAKNLQTEDSLSDGMVRKEENQQVRFASQTDHYKAGLPIIYVKAKNDKLRLSSELTSKALKQVGLQVKRQQSFKIAGKKNQ